jgi:hypothetical protein
MYLSHFMTSGVNLRAPHQIQTTGINFSETSWTWCGICARSESLLSSISFLKSFRQDLSHDLQTCA